MSEETLLDKSKRKIFNNQVAVYLILLCAALSMIFSSWNNIKNAIPEKKNYYVDIDAKLQIDKIYDSSYKFHLVLSNMGNDTAKKIFYMLSTRISDNGMFAVELEQPKYMQKILPGSTIDVDLGHIPTSKREYMSIYLLIGYRFNESKNGYCLFRILFDQNTIKEREYNPSSKTCEIGSPDEILVKDFIKHSRLSLPPQYSNILTTSIAKHLNSI